MRSWTRAPAAVTLLLTVAAGQATTARGAESAQIEAVEISDASAIAHDGRLLDAIWETAPVIDAFVQRTPHEGAAPSFPTQARVAYDATNLYVSVRAFDPEPEAIVGILTRRDENSPSDWLRIAIDSYHDGRTAYEFAVNPVGVKQDKYRFNDNAEDVSWDAVWDVVVSRDAEGWAAEFRIPFSQLRFDPETDGTFGFAVARQVGRLNEMSTWPLLARSASGMVSSFGDLIGLKVPSSGRRLELVPYMVSTAVTQPAEPGNPLVDPTDFGADPGMDLKFAVTPALTLTGTVNPDFGQVEADPAEVNLSAFETFFSERRPFFVEGAGVFKFDVDCNDGNCTGLFYSRRIGRAPQGNADTPDDGYSVAPAQTTILGASKLTGRIGSFSIGALNAVTSSEHATISHGASRLSQDVEPITSLLSLTLPYTGRSSRESCRRPWSRQTVSVVDCNAPSIR